MKLPVYREFCATCPAFGRECPGHRPESCGCVRVGAERFHCARCHLVCLDRRDETEGRLYDAVARYQDTIGFNEVSFAPTELPALQPPWIPVVDQRRDAPALASYPVVACSLRYAWGLFAQRRGNRDKATKNLAAAMERISGRRVLLLHGTDDILGRFWKQVDDDFFARVRELGFIRIIGPGFSTYDSTKLIETDEDRNSRERQTYYPEFMNVMAVRKQLTVMQMASRRGFAVTPILNYRNPFVEARWAELLLRHETLDSLALDLSMVRQPGKTFDRQMLEHTRLLTRVDKPLTLYLLGAGEQNYRRCREALANPKIRLVPLSSRMAYQSFNIGRFMRLWPDRVEWIATTQERPRLYEQNLVSADVFYGS